jgi:hypothetical protein
MLVRTAHCFQLLVDSMLANHLLICGLLASTRVCHRLVLLLRGQTRLTTKPPVKGTLALRRLCSLLSPKLYCALGATGAFGGIGLSPAQTTTNGCSTTNGVQLEKALTWLHMPYRLQIIPSRAQPFTSVQDLLKPLARGPWAISIGLWIAQ